MAEIFIESNHGKYDIENIKYALLRFMRHVNRFHYGLRIGTIFIFLRNFNAIPVQQVLICSIPPIKDFFCSTSQINRFQNLLIWNLDLNLSIKISFLGVIYKPANQKTGIQGELKYFPGQKCLIKAPYQRRTVWYDCLDTYCRVMWEGRHRDIVWSETS